MDIDGLIAKHINQFKKQTKYSFPDEILCTHYPYIRNREHRMRLMLHYVTKKSQSLKKHTLRYPFSNLTGIKT